MLTRYLQTLFLVRRHSSLEVFVAGLLGFAGGLYIPDDGLAALLNIYRSHIDFSRAATAAGIIKLAKLGERFGSFDRISQGDFSGGFPACYGLLGPWTGCVAPP